MYIRDTTTGEITMNKVITTLATIALALTTIACDEVETNIMQDQDELCYIGVDLNDDNTATLSTCGKIQTTIETWVDVWTCDLERLPWSRVIVAPTNFDAGLWSGEFTFTHNGIDDRDVADMGEVEICFVSWQMLEVEEGSYTGYIMNEGYYDLNGSPLPVYVGGVVQN
tara:strand:- start:155 stop:661 length:507 start_codon:yes stop_codon:yes gene_type:complete